MQPLTVDGSLSTIVLGFLFGFGFAIAGSLWSALVGLANRPKS